METKESNLLFFFLLFSLSFQISIGTIDIKHKYSHNKTNGAAAKLFIFGDSYVDTGNWEKGTGPWLKPFGISFPGKPYGRFSDGQVLTDYIAAFFGIRSPVPFQWRKIADKSRLQNGMNFAYGGAGVFNTWKDQNLGFQINLLKHQHQLEENKYVYTKSELERSIALISIAGNDYGFFFKQQNGTLKNFQSFSGRVVEQLVKDMKQIHDLGVPRIALLAMEPNGCLPESTQQSSYKKCNQEYNSIAKFHNNLLRKAVRKLNEEHKKPVYVILDLYKAFISAIKKNQQNTTGNLKYYKNPLEPCVKVASNKRFEVCKYPAQSFFWDSVHPSQNGWHAIYLELRHSLHELTN